MVNTLQFGDIAGLQDLVPAAVDAAREHLEASRAELRRQGQRPDRGVPGPPGAPGSSSAWTSLLAQQRGKREQVSETAGELRRLTEALRTAGEPLLRVLAVLVPGRRGERPMSYDSITNRGDYLSPHYLAEVLPRDLAKKTSLRTRWAERDKARRAHPGQGTARPAPRSTSTRACR